MHTVLNTTLEFSPTSFNKHFNQRNCKSIYSICRAGNTTEKRTSICKECQSIIDLERGEIFRGVNSEVMSKIVYCQKLNIYDIS